MPQRTSITGRELFIVDNSDADWKLVRNLKPTQAPIGVNAILKAWMELN